MLATAGLPSLASTEVESATVDDTGTDQRETTIEEIVVTSRKREETLQKVPVAVTAFTTTNLAEITAADASDIARYWA